MTTTTRVVVDDRVRHPFAKSAFWRIYCRDQGEAALLVLRALEQANGFSEPAAELLGIKAWNLKRYEKLLGVRHIAAKLRREAWAERARIEGGRRRKLAPIVQARLAGDKAAHDALLHAALTLHNGCKEYAARELGVSRIVVRDALERERGRKGCRTRRHLV